jgi:hypothetical protein
MEEVELTLLREIGFHRAQNRFYRECYPLLKELQDSVERAITDLLLLYYSDSHPERCSTSYSPVNEVTNLLELVLENTSHREMESTQAWNNFPNYS